MYMNIDTLDKKEGGGMQQAMIINYTKSNVSPLAQIGLL